jgi:uncharacterized protein
MKRVAVVGAGIAGLGAALSLRQALPPDVGVCLFEAEHRLGGHANTVEVTLPGHDGRLLTHGVDTGFLVYNERTYPRLIAMFDALQVPTAASDMSFSVQVPALTPARAKRDVPSQRKWLSGLEWSGSNLSSVFTQRSRLLSLPFWRMLSDIMRFNRLATRLATANDDQRLSETVASFLDTHGFSQAFRDGYLLPMVACIWSCPVQQMMQFPIGTLIRFCHNHGLLQVANRPQWFTVRGGSREYVKRLVAAFEQAGGQVQAGSPVLGVQRSSTPDGGGWGTGAMVQTASGAQWFDHVVLACHSDQALALLGGQATADEQALLGAIRYHPNRAVLHTDTALMPRHRRAWAAWNYERAALDAADPNAVCLHYWINRLQPLPWQQTLVVSLNPLREPRPETVIQTFEYAHPVFDQAAVQAQQQLHKVQGKHAVWFCGAWAGYGFHEDGLASGQQVAQALAAQLQPLAMAA